MTVALNQVAWSKIRVFFEEKPGYMGQPDFKIVMSTPEKVMYYNKKHNSTEDFAFVFCSFFLFVNCHIFVRVHILLYLCKSSVKILLEGP